MRIHTTLLKAFAAAAIAISTAIGLTSLAGGAASADGPKPGREAVYYTITLTNGTVAESGGLLPAISQPGIIGGFKAMTGAEQRCPSLICGNNGSITSTPSSTSAARNGRCRQ